MNRRGLRLLSCIATGLVLGIAVTGCGDDDDVEITFDQFFASLSGANQVPDPVLVTRFVVPLNGGNEVPSVTTGAAGTATFDISSVDYTVELNSITAVTATHIHSGSALENGPIMATLYPGPTTGDVDGMLVEGSFTEADDPQMFTIDDIIASMRAGSAYVNVHTMEVPSGEVRGQITPPSGSASFMLDGSMVQYEIDLFGATEITAAHIHAGSAASSGAVLVTLFAGPTTGQVDGRLTDGSFMAADVADGTTFDDLLTMMRNGDVYVNVHSTAHPAGEMRGQVTIVQ